MAHHMRICENQRNAARQQHVAKVFLRVIWGVFALGGWLHFFYNKVSLPLPSSSKNRVSDKALRKGVEPLASPLRDRDRNSRTSLYDRLDECIPCSADEEQELAHYAPGMIIPGAQKGGTSFMLHILGQHPDVADFRREAHILDNSLNLQGGVVHQCEVWREYKELNSQCKNCKPHQFFVDKTPKYLWQSHFIPQRLACVFPRPIKILVILRNPTQRAFSQYQMKLRKLRQGINGTDGEFYDMIVSERQKLEVSGVFPGLEKEVAFRAWKQYHDGVWKTDEWKRTRRDNQANNITTPEDVMPAILGRGLYALQLTHWIDTLSELWGISQEELVKNYVLVVDNDDVKADTQAAMNHILDFAGLAPHEFNVEEIGDSGQFHNYSAPTDQEREFLDEFFRPYNADLHRLLEPHGIEIGFAKKAAIAMK